MGLLLVKVGKYKFYVWEMTPEDPGGGGGGGRGG